ncbi:MAG: AAA family ATPase [Victivallales bacterium]|nr:AAA family ATPase [Victivallales bacterium]
MAKLTVIEGPNAGQEYQFDGGRIVLGRIEGCDIVISHGSISRQHAAFTLVSGAWKLDDLGSQNGIIVNGQSMQSCLLKTTCDIQFGQVIVRFEPGDEIAVVTPTSPERITFSNTTDINSEDVKSIGKVTTRVLSEFGRVIVGQQQVAQELLIAVAAGGHCLMIGLPGLAKTLMVSTLAKILKLQFKRVQFTPDLMPSDIIGTDILDVDEQGKRSFRFIKGPVFTNMLLADEINRTPPKTQAALLEAMQEKQVTASNQLFKLPPPFFVLATQNPLEQEGTYPLPEAQLDRFMFNILVDYPEADEEEQIVMATTTRKQVDLAQVLSADDLVRIQAIVRDLPVSPHVVKYATRLVRMTRPKSTEAPDFIRQNIHCGAGPRAAQCLVLGAKARAVLQGRVNVSCNDVKALALPVLRHRLFTNFTADSEGITTDDIVRRLLENCPEPSAKDY